MQVEKTKIVVNEKGQLLDHDGKVVDLVVPMTPDDRRRLIKDIKEELKPLISHTCEQHMRSGIEPV